MIWLAFGALALAVAVLLLQPLWRRRAPAAAEAADIAFYRDQLAELERDQALGYLNAEQAAAGRLEIQRRLLAAAELSAAPAASPSAPAARQAAGVRARVALAIPLLAVLLAGSLALYLEIGSPGAVQTGALQSAAAGRHPSDVDGMEFARLVEQLQAKLKENPRDVDGWLLLARSERTIDKLPEAAEAYLRALALSGGRPDIASAYGELLIEIAQGVVTPAALDLFHQALAREPGEPRARFYLGLAKAQSGDSKGALADWSALLADAPPDAPYIPAVREQIAEVAQSAGLPAPAVATPPSPPASAMASPPAGPPASPSAGAAPRGPSSADMAAAATMSPEDRQQMIRGMVEGLAARLKAKPDDIDGWLRLARAYGVLGEPARARDALAEAAKQAPERVDVLTAYADALYTPAQAAAKPPAEYVAVMRRILTLEPTNPQAMWFVANDAAQAGDRQGAAALYKKLLERLPPNAPLRPQVQRQLEAIQGG
jgi:cytochrome c-type biogenesis protein CcmH